MFRISSLIALTFAAPVAARADGVTPTESTGHGTGGSPTTTSTTTTTPQSDTTDSSDSGGDYSSDSDSSSSISSLFYDDPSSHDRPRRRAEPPPGRKYVMRTIDMRGEVVAPGQPLPPRAQQASARDLAASERYRDRMHQPLRSGWWSRETTSLAAGAVVTSAAQVNPLAKGNQALIGAIHIIMVNLLDKTFADATREALGEDLDAAPEPNGRCSLLIKVHADYLLSLCQKGL